MSFRSRHIFAVRLLVVAIAVCGCAQALHAEDAVESGRDSLSDDYPWYDADTDELRRVDVPEIEEPDDDLPEPPVASTGGTDALSGLVQVVFWIVVMVVIAAFIGLLLWAFIRGENRQAVATDSGTVESSSEVDRIENLPFKVRRPQSDLLEEARRLYQEGNFGEAIIYLFSYKLVQLDKFHFIRLAKGKTNRQYLGEVRPQPRLRELLETTMVTFEDVFFGHHELDRGGFETCWSGLDEFHQHVNQGTI